MSETLEELMEGTDSMSREELLSELENTTKAYLWQRGISADSAAELAHLNDALRAKALECDEIREDRDHFAKLWTQATEGADRWDDRVQAAKAERDALREERDRLAARVVELLDKHESLLRRVLEAVKGGEGQVKIRYRIQSRLIGPPLVVVQVGTEHPQYERGICGPPRPRPPGTKRPIVGHYTVWRDATAEDLMNLKCGEGL